MKNLNFLKIILLLFVFLLLFSVCGGNVDIVNDNVVIDEIEYMYEDGYMEVDVDVAKQGLEYIFVYICFMYCDGSGSDKFGECLVCGMDYVKNENMLIDGYMYEDGYDYYYEDGYDYDYDYEGYNY